MSDEDAPKDSAIIMCIKKASTKKYCNSNLRISFHDPEALSFLWKAVLSGKRINSSLLVLLKSSKIDVNQRINYKDMDDPRLESVSSNILIVLSRSINEGRWSNDCRLARALIDKGIDVNDVEFNSYYNTKNTALYYALTRGNVELAKLLLRRGASVKVLEHTDHLQMYAQYWMKNPNGILPLLYKYLKVDDRNKMEFVKLMVEYGVPLDGVTDKWGFTPLYDAIFARDCSLVKNLLKNGADVNYRTNDTTPLFLATTQANLTLMKLLLDNDARVNDAGFEGQTPLHIACRLNLVGKINLLLKHGADPNVLDDNAKTPFWYLIEEPMKITTCVELMLKQLAILVTQRVDIHDEPNLNEHPVLLEFMENCLVELTVMREVYFYKEICVYDVLTSSLDDFDELVRDEEFVEKFRLSVKHYHIYAHDLQGIFQYLLSKRDEWTFYERHFFLDFCQINKESKFNFLNNPEFMKIFNYNFLTK